MRVRGIESDLAGLVDGIVGEVHGGVAQVSLPGTLVLLLTCTHKSTPHIHMTTRQKHDAMLLISRES